MPARFALAPFVALALVGCVTEPPEERLFVEVELSQNTITPGEVIEIEVRATNVTRDHLTFSTNACVLVAQVLDERGQEAYPGYTPCADILILHDLSPGDVLEETFEFDGYAQGGPERDWARFPLPEGSYFVRGTVSAERLNPSSPVGLTVIAASPSTMGRVPLP